MMSRLKFINHNHFLILDEFEIRLRYVVKKITLLMSDFFLTPFESIPSILALVVCPDICSERTQRRAIGLQEGQVMLGKCFSNII